MKNCFCLESPNGYLVYQAFWFCNRYWTINLKLSLNSVLNLNNLDSFELLNNI